MDFLFKWVLSKAKEYVLRNYKTTLAGLLAVVVTQIPALAPFKDPILAAIVALVGILAKDGDQTGTIERPRTVPEVVAAQNAAPEAAVVAIDSASGG